MTLDGSISIILAFFRHFRQICSQIQFNVGRRGLDGLEPGEHIRSSLDEKLTASPDHALDAVTLDSLDDFVHGGILSARFSRRARLVIWIS